MHRIGDKCMNNGTPTALTPTIPRIRVIISTLCTSIRYTSAIENNLCIKTSNLHGHVSEEERGRGKVSVGEP